MTLGKGDEGESQRKRAIRQEAVRNTLSRALLVSLGKLELVPSALGANKFPPTGVI